MLCSKCYEDIPQGKKIQIEGTIICKKCALDSLAKKEVVDRCNRCFKLIYKDEITHEVYENWGTENSEKLIKCQPCYEEWLKMAKLRRKKWEITRWFDNAFLPFSMWFVLAAITINKNKEHVGREVIFLIIILTVSNMLLSPASSLIIEKVLEWKYKREYRYHRNKNRKLKQEVAKLTKKVYETVIQVVKSHWKHNQSKSKKINGLTITEVLGEDWEANLKDKEKKDVLTETNWLIKKIDDAKLAE